MPRILLVTVALGWYHSSIPRATEVIRQVAGSAGLEVDAIAQAEELATISPATLERYQALVFANSSGELPLDAGQRQALLDFVRGGGAFLGFHGASDTLKEWPEYGALVGAFFKEHPWTQDVRITVEDRAHPTTQGLPESYAVHEEIYTFHANPRPNVHVLQSLDGASVGAEGDYPLAWWQDYGAGRSYYNALGHFDHIWDDERFQMQLLAALRWAIT
jgi:type 1 glutamine amidotransferase